jgi:hypothetical protein
VVVLLVTGAGMAHAGEREREDILQELATLRRAEETPGRLADEARLLHFLAEASGGEERAQARREGLALAERALARNPREPGALLWWTAHRGAQASMLNPFEAVQIAREVEERLLLLRDVDPAYEHSAADRVLGHVYQVAPAGLSIGSMKKAELHLRAAMARHPRFPANQLLYGQLLMRSGDCHGAQGLARAVLDSDELERHPLERAGWKAEAAQLAARAKRECR